MKRRTRPPFKIRSEARKILQPTMLGFIEIPGARRWHVHYQPTAAGGSWIVASYNTFEQAIHHVDTAVARYEMRNRR